MATESKKQIQVFAPGYRSRRTATQLIAPGVYNSDSPEMAGGIAADIVAAGAGAWVKGKPVKALEDLPPDETTPSREDIEALTKEQLIIMARQHDMGKPATGDTKDEWKALILDFWGY